MKTKPFVSVLDGLLPISAGAAPLCTLAFAMQEAAGVAKAASFWRWAYGQRSEWAEFLLQYAFALAEIDINGVEITQAQREARWVG